MNMAIKRNSDFGSKFYTFTAKTRWKTRFLFFSRFPYHDLVWIPSSKEKTRMADHRRWTLRGVYGFLIPHNPFTKSTTARSVLPSSFQQYTNQRWNIFFIILKINASLTSIKTKFTVKITHYNQDLTKRCFFTNSLLPSFNTKLSYLINVWTTFYTC